MFAKKTVAAFYFMLIYNFVFCQVQSLNYHIRYNTTSCLFDCCIIIIEGNATTAVQRAQFNSQYSIVVPTGSNVSIAKLRNPIQSNQNYGGTQPLIWYVGSVVQNPESLPGSDIYSITPTLTPTSFYNNLYEGDTIVLFSLNISPVLDCGTGVRVFENGVDPDSGAPGMGGGDFSNGFTMGSVEQKYNANSPAILPPAPSINTLLASCTTGLEINLSATTSSTCQGTLKYSWKGPDGFSSGSEDVSIPNPTPFNAGHYSVTVSDNNGCKNTAEILAFAKPDAGPDQTVKCYSTGAATITAKGVGTWQISQNSAGTALIQDINNKNTAIYGFSSPGIYYLVWSSAECSDTVVVNAQNICSCVVSPNILTIPDNNSYCGNSEVATLHGSLVTNPQGSYKWVYSKDNQAYVTAPGNNSSQDYITSSFGTGNHKLRRIFQKTIGPVCSDTSNVIEINVMNYPNAGEDDTLFCIESDTAFLHSVSMGFWSIGQGSAGTAKLSAVTANSIKISDFSTTGHYDIIRSNEICNDTIRITVLDWCGCDYSDAGPDTNNCVGDTVQLTGNCMVGIWEALPSNPLGAILSPTNEGQSVLQFSNQAAGNFKFVFSVLERYFDTINISVLPRPNVNLGEDFGFCEDAGSIILTASGATTYIWSTGESSNSIMVIPDSTSLFYVTGTDADGCFSTDTLTITMYEKPQGTIPQISPVFESEPLMLTAGVWSNAMTYTWTGPGNFVANSPDYMIPNVTKANEGLYTLMVMSPDECMTLSSVNVQVIEIALPVSLNDFHGQWNQELKSIDLDWSVFYEFNNDSYIIERMEKNRSIEVKDHIKGSGTTKQSTKYFYRDTEIKEATTYIYILKQIDLDGRIQVLGNVKVTTGSGENMTSLVFRFRYLLYKEIKI